MQATAKLQSCPLHQQVLGKFIELNFLEKKKAPNPPTEIPNDLLSNNAVPLFPIKLGSRQPSL